jgi:replicative DNA helicase
MTREEHIEVSDFFEYVEDEILDGKLPDVELVINELAPVVRRHMQSIAVLKAHDEFAKKGDFTAVQGLLSKAQRVGVSRQASSVRLTEDVFSILANASGGTRLSTGILELDLALDGGSSRKELGVLLGSSGGGKSQQLIHQAATGIRRHMYTGFITLELSMARQLGRLMGNLTGVPVKGLLIEGSPDYLEAQRRFKAMSPHLGRMEIGDFVTSGATVQDVIEWVDEKEQDSGQKMDLLVIDYADKLTDMSAKADNEYLMMRNVYGGLRDQIAEARNMWVWTAAQANRGGDKRRRLDMSDVADSMHKVRISDMFITLNNSEEGTTFFIAKNRNGNSRMEVGPLMTDWARGRMVPLTQEFADWGRY